jgi:hypothetical protein
VTTLADLFDAEVSGQILKDRGLEQVREHAGTWIDGTLAALRVYASTRKHLHMAADDYLAWHLQHGYPLPHHANAWGAVWQMAKRERIVEATGHYTKSKAKNAHQRMIPVYRVL